MELSLDVWSSETRPDGKLKMTAHIIRAVRGKKLKKGGGGADNVRYKHPGKQ